MSNRENKRMDAIRKRLRQQDVVAVLVYRNGRMADVTQDNFDDMVSCDGRIYTRIVGGRKIICADDEVLSFTS